MNQTLDDCKVEHMKKCLLVGELEYRRRMDQEMMDSLIKEIQAINQKAATLTPKEEKHE